MRPMVNKYPRFVEIIIAAIGFIIGLLVAILISLPIDRFFLHNFAEYWGSQLCVLLLLLPFKPRPAILGGVAFALAIYLGAFSVWFFSIRHCDAMGWLGYLFSLPGAAVGALYSVFHLRKYSSHGPFSLGFIAACHKHVGRLYSFFNLQENASYDAVSAGFVAACYTFAVHLSI